MRAAAHEVVQFSLEWLGKTSVFDSIIGYEGIKRTFPRSLNSKEPVHILLVGPPGQAKTLFLKCILETFGEKKTFFTVGGNSSKSGMIDVLFDMRPRYLLVDEIEHLKPEYQAALLSLTETGKSLRSFKVSIENDNVYVQVDFQVVQAFPSFENLKDRQLHFSTEHGA